MKAFMTLAVATTLLTTLATAKAHAADDGQSLAPQKASVCKQLAAFDKSYPIGGTFKADLATWCNTKIEVGPDTSEMDLVIKVSDDLSTLDTANLPMGAAGDKEADQASDVAGALSEYANAFVGLPWN